MCAIVHREVVLSNANEQTNNVQREDEIYQLINLIKLGDPLEEVRSKPDKKYGKLVIKSEINEIGDELNVI